MKNISKKIKSGGGYTMIELLIYIGIVTAAILVFTNFMVDITKNSARAQVKQEVQQNARLILSRLTQEIRNAKQITSVNPERIILINPLDQDITFQWDNINKEITYDDGTGPIILSGQKIRITQLNFQQNNNTISINFKVEQKNPNAQSADKSEITLSSAVVPRSILY
jgi:type II secretory pathway pseudopilin PulG